MSLTYTPVAPERALGELNAAVHRIKGDQPLRPVSVIVATNATGVTARRFLGRTTGIAAVDMLTLARLAEVIAGPHLARSSRPVSAPVLELTIRAVLADLGADDASPPGNLFAPVARHASTISALADLYDEVRWGGDAALAALTVGSAAAQAAVEVCVAVGDRLAGAWYDKADLFTTAAAMLGAGTAPPAAQNVIVFLPDPPRAVERILLAALAGSVDIEVLSTWTGRPPLDDEFAALVEMANATTEIYTEREISTERQPTTPSNIEATRSPTEIISVTDADEEVRLVTRKILDAARDGVSFDRMAVLWPQTEPYARLVEHHLSRADIGWNGRPGTQVSERIVPRFLLDLLEVDRRGLRRSAVFELLADINIKDSDGTNAPTARWERVARAAGIADDSDWNARLRRYAERQRRRAAEAGSDASRRADDAEALLAFVGQLRRDLGHRRDTRTWAGWADWARNQISSRLGSDLLAGRAEAERLASDHTQRVLDRLGHLDELGGGPVTRADFRAVFAAEFDGAPGRIGRIGQGVTVGSIAGHHALDADRVFVLGAAEGVMPPHPRADPLISEADRTAAGLPSTQAPGRRIERQFFGVLASIPHVTVTFPRGDLRGSLERFPSRWIAEHVDTVTELPSHHAALLANDFPVNDNEFRLRQHLAASAVRPLGVNDAADDPTLRAALSMRAARRSPEVTVYDGDLSSVSVPPISDPVSPSRIEAWPHCPQAYFQRYLLGVYELDDPGLELSISPMERGNVLHQTLDRLHREVLDGLLPQPTTGWSDTHVERGVELFDEVADEFAASGRTGRPAAWSVERRSLRSELLGWFEADSRRLANANATIISSEARFGGGDGTAITLADGRGLFVHGSIDRIDRLGDGTLKVVDHKTGGDRDYRSLSGDNPTNGGRSFQLPVYAAGARKLAGDPSAPVTAAYSMMAKGNYREFGYAFTPEVEDRVTAALSRVMGGIEAGFFPPTPVAPGFQVFIPCAYCDPDGLGTAAKFDEMSNKGSDPRMQRWLVSGVDEQA